jgi:hypothetical protein
MGVCAWQMLPDFLLEWFGSQPTDWALELLKEMLAKDLRSNLQMCVQVPLFPFNNNTHT